MSYKRCFFVRFIKYSILLLRRDLEDVFAQVGDTQNERLKWRSLIAVHNLMPRYREQAERDTSRSRDNAGQVLGKNFFCKRVYSSNIHHFYNPGLFSAENKVFKKTEFDKAKHRTQNQKEITADIGYKKCREIYFTVIFAVI